MSDLTTYGKDPYPTGPEAAWVPGSMMAYAESVDPKHVHTVSSQADRDGRFAGLPAGYLVTCAPLKTVWMSLGGGAWETVYSDTGWVAIASTAFGAGFTASPSGNRWRQTGKVVDLYLSATYTGPDITDADGNIPDMELCTSTAPPPTGGLIPGNTWSSAPLFFLLNSTGKISVTHMMAGGTLTTGSLVYTHVCYTV